MLNITIIMSITTYSFGFLECLSLQREVTRIYCLYQLLKFEHVINPRRACAARVTVLGLSVSQSVSQSV